MKAFKIIFTIISLLLCKSLTAQNISLSPTQNTTLQNQVKELILNYETSLNNLGDSRDGIREKEYFITDILQHIFENKNVLVYNDLDPDNKESKDLKVDTYLNNIITKYSKGAVFDFTDLHISPPLYLDSTHIFLKAELTRALQGIHIDQEINNKLNIDIYVSVATHQGEITGSPSIYSITPHEDNIEDFEKVKIRSAINRVGELSILKPASKNVYIRGKKYPIQWAGGTDIEHVTIDLYENDELTASLSKSATGNILYWDIPNTTRPGSQYSIKVSVPDSPTKADFSEKFTIRRKVPLAIKFIPMAAVAATAYILLSGSDKDSDDNALPLPPEPPD